MAEIKRFEGNNQDIHDVVAKRSPFALSFVRHSQQGNGLIRYYVSWMYYFFGSPVSFFPFIFSLLLIGILSLVDGVIPQHSQGFVHLFWFLGSVLIGYIVLACFKPRAIVVSDDGTCAVGGDILFEKSNIEKFYVVKRSVSTGKYSIGKLYDVQYKLIDGSTKYLYSSFSLEEIMSSMKYMLAIFDIDCIDYTENVPDSIKSIGADAAHEPMTLKKFLLIFLVIIGGAILIAHLVSL